MIKFRAKRVNGGEWVKSMTISYGTIKRKMYNVFFEVEPNKWVGVIPETVCQFSEITDKNGVEKTLTLPAMKFLSVRTWDKVRDYIRFHDDMGHLWDERMRRCDTERVGRVVNHFQNDDNAYFMVINAPNTEVHLITGEIGICSLLTGQRGHFELPRVSYQTSKGNVVLFPDEIMPVDINLLQQEINEGYIMLSDGRYLPPKETVQQCYNAFGIRVGLGDNWEDIYDSWNKEMK
jgi:hypothetical protein